MRLRTGFFQRLLRTVSLFSILVSALVMFPVNGQRTRGPHFDKLEYLTIKNPYLHVKAMKLGQIDMYPGLTRPGEFVELYLAGKNIIYQAGGHLCYITFNLRNYTVEEPPGWGAGYPASHAKRFMLNPWFRFAVALLVPKDRLIGKMFKYTAVRADSVVPPTLPKYNYTKLPKIPFSPGTAKKILESPYFGGYDYIEDHWVYEDNGDPLGEIEFLSPSFEEDPVSYTIVESTVKEMHKIGLTNIHHIGMTFSDMLNRHVYPHAFDMMLSSWKELGPDPDHLWAFFNSANDLYGGRNHPGVCDPYIDYLTNIIHTSLDDRGEVVPAALEVQRLLMTPYEPYSLCYIPILTKHYFDAYHPELAGMVNMPLVGSGNYWTFLHTRWMDGVGPRGDNSLRPVLSSDVFNLNPLVARWADEVETLLCGAGQEEIVSLVFDRLMLKNPYELEDIYGMAEYRDIERYIGPSDFGPVDGMKFTYRLRDDVFWHCGAQFTTEDVKFALDYVADKKPSQWINAWEDYVGTKTIDTYHCEIYYNKTSLWLKDTVETAAAMLPKHIWEGVTDWEHFYPWNENHTGNIQIPGAPSGHYLKKLCGTGECIFDYTDPGEMYTVLYPNPNYWKSQIDVSINLDDMFYWHGDIVDVPPVWIDISDLVEVGLGWASKYPEPRYMAHIAADIAPSPDWPDPTPQMDGFINVRDATVCGRGWFDYKWYPPW